ncbi:MAG: TolC family protein [Muribaculaceae bacterium]|nr:TolC family protein [Muribaculaceae bacterium]
MRHLLSLVLAIVFFASSQAQVVYSLEQLCDSAQRSNIAIRAAKHDIEAARLQKKEAHTSYFPTVSATGLWFDASKGMAEMTINPQEYIPQELGAIMSQMLPPSVLAPLSNPVNVSMMKNGILAGVTAVQPIYAGGRIVNGNKLARVGEDVSQLKLEMSENEVEKTTEQYFWQLVSLQEKMKTVEASQALLASIFKDTELAVKVGVAIRNDLLQVQLRQNELTSQKMKLNNGISMVKLLLSQYCALSDTSFAITYNEEVVAPERLRQDHNLAVLNTPEYRLLKKQVEASELQEKIERGKNLPSVAVGAGYNYHNLLDKNNSFAMVFATVSIPISGWFTGKHAVNRTKIGTYKAREQLDDNAQLLVIRMQNAWNGVEEAYNQIQLAQLSIEQATENLRVNRDHYNAGLSRMSNLLEAQLIYQQACDKRIDAFIEYQIKTLEYQQAIGANGSRF